MRNRYFSAIISDLKCNYDFVMDGTITPEQNVDNIINKEKLSDIQGVFKVFLDDLYVGKTVDEMLNDASKLGPILIKAKTRAECYQIIETIKNTFYITVDSSGVETDIVW